MVSTNNFFAALLELAEKSESSGGADQDDGFTEIRRKGKGRRATSSNRSPETGQDGTSQHPRSRLATLNKAVNGHTGDPATNSLTASNLADGISRVSVREDGPKGVPKENGKAGSAGSALSYAAVAADSTAAQQPPDTSAASEASQAAPAEQSAADEASASSAAAKEEETPSVAAGASAATEHKSSGSRQSKSGLRQPLVWLDLEMTGLDLENDTIIEAACLMSDGNLETTIEGPEIAIQQSEAVLASMNPWCIDHHGASGLTQRCRESTVSIEQAEEQLLEFVGRHTEPGEARLAGNSVHVDMQFLRRRMPRLFAHFHHRIIDVSTVAELAARWFPADYRSAPRKKGSHTALADVRESLEELRFYRKTIFKQPPSQNRRRR